jgi:hypothetical protein
MVWLGLAAASTLAFGQESPTPASATEATEAVESDVQDEAARQTAERREKIMREAIDALAQTKDALTALEEKRIDDALAALAVTTGKLELIVARDPDLGLAPTDLTVTTRDVLATPAAIESAIDRAQEALEDGRVQEARGLLSGLGSEIVLTEVNLPLATYPDAIKAITPLIDAGKIEEAKNGLQAALSTLVLTDYVVPLPVLRADQLLEKADELAQKADRTDEENRSLADNLSAARGQLEMAELLGYDNRDDYSDLYAQLDRVEEQTDDGKFGTGFFDNVKRAISKLWTSPRAS